MALVSIVCAILLQKFRPPAEPDLLAVGLARLAQALEGWFNAGERRYGMPAWLSLMLAAYVPATVVHWACAKWAPALAWLWSIAVLYLALRFRVVLSELALIQKALAKDDLDEARDRIGRWLGRTALRYDRNQVAKAAIEHALVECCRGFFGVTFWFIVLPGPGGALAYRAALAAAERWRDPPPAPEGGEPVQPGFGWFAQLAVEALDWIPQRLAAISFAVVGDFEDALYCWRTQAQSWDDPREAVVLTAAAGALGVRLGDPLAEGAGFAYRPSIGLGEEADSELMESSEGLIWRAALFWLLVVLLFSLGFWLA